MDGTAVLAKTAKGAEEVKSRAHVEIRSAPPATPAASAPPQTRVQAMSALTRMLHDAIGPDADMLTGRLEKAKTRAEFVAAVERCTDTLEALAGKARAQAFGARATAFADQYFGGA